MIPLLLEHHAIFVKEHISEAHYMFILLIPSFIQDCVLIVKLLREHLVKLEIGIAPEPQDYIHKHLGAVWLIKDLVVFPFLDSLH